MRTRLVLMLALGLMLWPIAGRATGWHNPLNTMSRIAAFAGTHIGEDYDGAENDEVYAIADGKVWYYKDDASCYGGGNGAPRTCPCEPGIVLFIRHRKSDGTYFIAQYGHIKNVPASLQFTGRNANGPSVAYGQHIGDIAQFAPCRDCSPRCDHLHFGWWDSQNDIPNSGWGYGPACYTSPDGCWVSASWAMANYTPYGGGGTPYLAHYLGQSASVTDWMAPNTSLTMWVDYRNDGNQTWTNTVHLRSVTGAVPCQTTNGCAYDPADWPSQTDMGPANQTSVAPGSSGRFQFQAKSAATTGNCVQWVAPYVPGGTCMDGWGGVNFTIKTDATPAAASLAPGTYQPGTYSSDITIGFNVTDEHSGPRGYCVTWDVSNSPNSGETQETNGSTTLAAQGTGGHTLYIRVWDQLGNTAVSNLGVYTYSPPPTNLCAGDPNGPCPGREIPRSCLHGPTECCTPGAVPGSQTMSDLTPEQWSSVGEPANLQSAGRYSIGLEYRAKSETGITVGFGGFNPSARSQTVTEPFNLTPSADGWRPYWSAPFEVSGDQLRTNPNLRLMFSNLGGVEVRNVRILKYK